MALPRRTFLLRSAAAWVWLAGGCGDKMPGPAREAGSPAVAGRPVPRVELSGRVTASGVPVRHAVVLLTPRDATAVARAQPGRPTRPLHAVTDRRGRFRVARVAVGTYGVTATAPGYFPASRTITVEASTSGLDLSLVSGGVDVGGTVLDVRGAPVAGAVVLGYAVDFPGQWWSGYAAITDDEGRYRLFAPRRTLWMHVGHPRMAEAPAPHVRPTEWTDLRDFRMERAASIEGRVCTADGVPVEGVLVFTPDATIGFAFPGGLTATDRDGRFVIDRLRAGAVELSAIGPHWAAPAPSYVEVGVGRTQRGVEIVVEPARPVPGRLQVGGHGRSGHFFRLEDPVTGAAVVNLAPSSDDGRFAIEGVLPGEYEVRPAWPIPWTNRPVEHVRVDARGVEPIDLSLPDSAPGGTLRVRVDATTGGDVVLEAHSREHSLPRALLLPRPLDPSGDVELADVPAGRYTVWARRSDGEYGTTEVDVASGVKSSVEIAIAPRGTLRGRVVDERGAPVVDAIVALSPERRIDLPLGWDPPQRRTSADGTFSIRGLAAGRWSASVMLAGRRLAWANQGESERWNEEHLAIEDDGAELEHVFAVVRPASVVLGRVLGPDGAPRADVRIQLRHADVPTTRITEDAERRESKVYFAAEPTIGSDEDGRFEVAGLIAGAYSLSAVDPLTGAFAELDLAAPAGDVVVRLTQPSRLTGRVTSRGSPVSRFALDLTNSGGCVGAQAGARGRLDVARLPPGHHEMGVVAPEGQLLFDVHVASGDTLSVDVELQPWAEIEGHVIGATGTPLAGLELRLIEEQDDEDRAFGFQPDVQSRTVFTDARGRFRFERVFPGRRRIRLAEPRGDRRGPLEREVDAKAGETASPVVFVVD